MYYTNPHPQMHPQTQPALRYDPNRLTVVNTHSGPMLMDITTNQIVGPAPQPSMAQMPQNPTYPGYPRPGFPQAPMQRYAMPQQPMQPPHPTLPVYSPQSVPQESSMSNDRYGVLTDIAHPPAQPAQAQTTTPASEVETVIEEAAAPRKFAAHLQMKSLPESLQNPPSLTAASVYNFSETMLGMGLDEVSRDLIRAAHGDKVQYRAIGTPYYWCEVFFNTRMSELAETFFQSDVKALYRSVKMITQEVTALEDAVFLSQFDLWITQHTNDWLNRHNGDLHIDSFSQDFEDLVMALRRQTLDHDERLMEHLRQTLGKAASDVHALQNSPSPERTDEQKERDALTMYLPHHGFMVFVRATSTALGDDGSSKGLEKMQKVMKSLRQCIGNKVKFEVFTADRRMYSVSFDLHDNVHVTQLS